MACLSSETLHSSSSATVMMLVDSVPSVDDNACIYDIHPPSLQYFAGMPAICVSFVGYLWIGTQPMLYPLYCPPASLDDLPEIMPFLNLPWLRGNFSSNSAIYGVYDHVGVARKHEPETLIHFAQYPYGYYLPSDQSVNGSESILQTTWVERDSQTQSPKNHDDLSQLAKGSRIPTHPHEGSFLTKDTQVPMSESAILVLALPWMSQFMYDNRRVAIHSMDDSRIFGLGNFFGLAQRHCIVDLLQMFICPYAHSLPLSMTYLVQQVNSFVKFLENQMAKELVYHVIFRTTATCRVRLTIADFKPQIFRNATNPPVDTLALIGSCCYQALLARLVAIWGTIDLMPDYPSVEDLQYVPFMGKLGELCTITTSQQLLTHFLGTEQTETALISWLQKQDRNTLPASLYITASVLFGWVDTHDLIALMDVSLREVAMQMQLQQEEERSCAAFRSRGGCLMEHRIHRAQMDVSLFSNAIANLSEELEIRFSSIVGPDSHANRTLFGSPQTIDDDPYIYESFQGLDDQFLSLPRLLRTWVDNMTYRAHMSASFAESRSLHIDTSDDFQPMKSKTTDILKSNMHILGLKKQRAQAEVDMFSEALARIAEFEGTDDGTPPGSAVTHVSLTSDDECFDECFSISYTSSYGSIIM
ncbi:hypothetical protein EV424DRAFT_1350868 [Suillus variegatus]|nr:hypothetical protein EV424DRAFT_1350868 [Suillus variegatus]